MSISLNDHENRIKALEEKLSDEGSQTGSAFKLLASQVPISQNGSIEFAEPMSKSYNALYVWSALTYYPNNQRTTLYVGNLLLADTYYGHGSWIGDTSMGYLCNIRGERNGIDIQQVIRNGGNMTAISVYALKLYYNFSYNIYKTLNSLVNIFQNVFKFKRYQGGELA